MHALAVLHAALAAHDDEPRAVDDAARASLRRVRLHCPRGRDTPVFHSFRFSRRSVSTITPRFAVRAAGRAPGRDQALLEVLTHIGGPKKGPLDRAVVNRET